MSYSFAKITSVADSDLLLAWAAKGKADLNFKKLSEERLTTNYSTTSIDIDAQLKPSPLRLRQQKPLLQPCQWVIAKKMRLRKK